MTPPTDERGVAVIDPASIPQHVANAAAVAWLQRDDNLALRRAVAAALTALMDDEQVRVPTYYKGTTQLSGHRYTTARDVLAAVLARADA